MARKLRGQDDQWRRPIRLVEKVKDKLSHKGVNCSFRLLIEGVDIFYFISAEHKPHYRVSFEV